MTSGESGAIAGLVAGRRVGGRARTAAVTGVAVLTDRCHEGVGLIHPGGHCRWRPGALGDPTDRLDVEDTLARERRVLEWPIHRLLRRKPQRLVIDRFDGLGCMVKAPGRASGPAAGREGDVDGPYPALVPGRVPFSLRGLDAAAAEPALDTHVQRLGTRCLGTGAQPTVTSSGGDVGTFGEHRPAEGRHLAGGPPRAFTDLLGADPAADQGLDIAGREGERGASRGRRPDRARGAAQGLIDRQQEARPVIIGKQQMLAGLVDADEAQVVHVQVLPDG